MNTTETVIPVLPSRGLPWRPFHPERLRGGPVSHLRGTGHDPGVRAVMELLEAEITSEADDVCRFGNENLARSAGCLEALRNFHATIKAAVGGEA